MHGADHPERDRIKFILEQVAELTPLELIELRARLGRSCLWCGSCADRLCDGPVWGRRETCDAPLCSSCALSKEIRGHLCTSFGHELLRDTVDYCPYCVERIAAKITPRERKDHDLALKAHAARQIEP